MSMHVGYRMLRCRLHPPQLCCLVAWLRVFIRMFGWLGGCCAEEHSQCKRCQRDSGISKSYVAPGSALWHWLEDCRNDRCHIEEQEDYAAVCAARWHPARNETSPDVCRKFLTRSRSSNCCGCQSGAVYKMTFMCSLINRSRHITKLA